MKLFLRIALLVSFLFLFSCRKEDKVEIRIENQSLYKMDNIIFNPMACAGTMEKSEDYGTLATTKNTDYKSFDICYLTPGATVDINGTIYKILPTNCSGSATLSPGKYTYVIKTKEVNGVITNIEGSILKDANPN